MDTHIEIYICTWVHSVLARLNSHAQQGGRSRYWGNSGKGGLCTSGTTWKKTWFLTTLLVGIIKHVENGWLRAFPISLKKEHWKDIVWGRVRQMPCRSWTKNNSQIASIYFNIFLKNILKYIQCNIIFISYESLNSDWFVDDRWSPLDARQVALVVAGDFVGSIESSSRRVVEQAIAHQIQNVLQAQDECIDLGIGQYEPTHNSDVNIHVNIPPKIIQFAHFGVCEQPGVLRIDPQPFVDEWMLVEQLCACQPGGPGLIWRACLSSWWIRTDMAAGMAPEGCQAKYCSLSLSLSMS